MDGSRLNIHHLGEHPGQLIHLPAYGIQSLGSGGGDAGISLFDILLGFSISSFLIGGFKFFLRGGLVRFLFLRNRQGGSTRRHLCTKRCNYQSHSKNKC